MLYQKYTLVSGIGKGIEPIDSFDDVLVKATIGNYNLVRVSSILPPNCCFYPIVTSPDGSILHIAYAVYTTNNLGIFSSAVAVAVPDDSQQCGVIMEYSGKIPKEKSLHIVTELAIKAMKRRNIEVKEVLSVGSEAVGNGKDYITTFAGIPLF